MMDYGDGDGDGYGYGGDGYGYGYGGDGYGYGYGGGYGYGDGYGYGYGEQIGTINGEQVLLLLPWPYVRVGCQVHSLEHWESHWRRIADAHAVKVSAAQVQELLLLAKVVS